MMQKNRERPIGEVHGFIAKGGIRYGAAFAYGSCRTIGGLFSQSAITTIDNPVSLSSYCIFCISANCIG